MQRTFRTGVNPVFACICLAPSIPFVFTLAQSGAPHTVLGICIDALFFLLAVSVPIFLYYSTRYIVDVGMLTVASGGQRWNIAVDTISAVRRIRTIESAPAMSCKRVLVRYGRMKSIIISPSDPKAFVAALVEAGLGADAKIDPGLYSRKETSPT